MDDVITRCLGLTTQYNPHQTAPGTLRKADNCVIDRENIVEDRRGYNIYGTLSNNIAKNMTYQGKRIAFNGTKVSYDNGSGSYSDYSGSYNAPSSQKMRFVEAFQSLYVTTDVGVQAFTDISGSAARKAGAPRSLDPSYALNAAGSGFLLNSSQCAYRVVILRIDANNNYLYGYPSQRLWVSNASGTAKNVDLTLYLPTEVTTADIIQFYRTAQVSGTSTDAAGDEMALVYQVSPSSTDISNGFITFTDIVIDALRGATLYTSPSQEGIAQANERPPLAKDIALFRNDFMVYANTTTKQRLFFTLVGVGSLSGKTIALGGVTYNFGASEIISGGGSPQVLVVTGGTDATNIDNTARSLVRVINRYAGNTTVYAYYLATPDTPPGAIMIEERGVGGAAFTVQSSDTSIAAMFFPPPPVSPATNSQSTSTNQAQKNALYISKAKQPEAVPQSNLFPVGATNKSILRIFALRESLIVIKEEGVFIMRGNSLSNFEVTALDFTVICKNLDTVTTLANQVFMLSNHGAVAISESGVQIISNELKNTLKKIIGFNNVSTYGSAVGYDSDGAYLLSVMTDSTDTAPTQIFRYNIFTRTWTRFSFGFTDAIIDPTTDKLVFSKTGSPSVYQERKNFTDSDYYDPDVAITIISINQTARQVVFTAPAVTPAAGWVISQVGVNIALNQVMANLGSYTGTLATPPPNSWTIGAATLLPSVGYDIIWNAWTGGQQGAGKLKQVSAIAILADPTPGECSASAIVPYFSSDFDEEEEEAPKALGADQGWNGPWGEIPWGGTGAGYGYLQWVPKRKQPCRVLYVGVKHKNAGEKLPCAGVAFQFEVEEEGRIGR